MLVHLPLADETGLPPALAAELDALERDTLQAASSVVATSEWAARRLVEHHGLAPHRVHAVPPGVDPAPPAVGTDGMSRLVCVATVTPRKGQGLLAQALETVADLRWTCECVGGIRRETKYVERLREHRLGARFTLTGPRTGAALAATYHTADLLVLPSRAETYGMVVTEALARGVPVLTTDVDALPDTVGVAPDGSVPGMLVPGDDVEALGAALRRWLTEPELRTRLRASAKLRRETLDRLGRHRPPDRRRPAAAGGGGMSEPRANQPARRVRPTGCTCASPPTPPPARPSCSNRCAPTCRKAKTSSSATSAAAPARSAAGWPRGCPAPSTGSCTTTTPSC